MTEDNYTKSRPSPHIAWTGGWSLTFCGLRPSGLKQRVKGFPRLDKWVVLLSWKVVGQPVWYTGLMSQECLQLESKSASRTHTIYHTRWRFNLLSLDMKHESKNGHQPGVRASRWGRCERTHSNLSDSSFEEETELQYERPSRAPMIYAHIKWTLPHRGEGSVVRGNWRVSYQTN